MLLQRRVILYGLKLILIFTILTLVRHMYLTYKHMQMDIVKSGLRNKMDNENKRIKMYINGTKDSSGKGFDSVNILEKHHGNVIQMNIQYPGKLGEKDINIAEQDKTRHTLSIRKNVLMLVADDMRPELSCYMDKKLGPPQTRIYSPNLDALAARSLLLKRAYVQLALCTPSRASLLTSRRPETTRVYDLYKYFRDGGNFTTLPEYFKQNGYRTVGVGKIFPQGRASNHDDPASWTDKYFHGVDYYYFNRQYSWKAIPENEWKQKPLQDQQIASHAKDMLRKLAADASSGKQPFFLAVGFRKPHLPIVFPDKFLQYYPPKEVFLPQNQYSPTDMPEVAWSNYGELRGYKDIKYLKINGAINTTLPANVVIDLRRAYYSAVSFIDSLIGEVVNELDNLGLSKDTIVSFWGDHGWQLGEHGEWSKHTNFEHSTHAPMMVHIPGMTDHGIVTDQLTEFVDLFPTLVDAAGLKPLELCPRNSSKIKLCTEGTSLMPLIKDPTTMNWKQHVFSQYSKNYRKQKVMGYSLRTKGFRFTEWVAFNHHTNEADWNNLYGRELYDLIVDPDENENVAHKKSYVHQVSILRSILHQGWRNAIP